MIDAKYNALRDVNNHQHTACRHRYRRVGACWHGEYNEARGVNDYTTLPIDRNQYRRCKRSKAPSALAALIETAETGGKHRQPEKRLIASIVYDGLRRALGGHEDEHKWVCTYDINFPGLDFYCSMIGINGLAVRHMYLKKQPELRRRLAQRKPIF